MTLNKRPSENTVRKGENASDQHFLIFAQCFLPFSQQDSYFQPHLSSANAFNFDWSRILLFDKKIIKTAYLSI